MHSALLRVCDLNCHCILLSCWKQIKSWVKWRKCCRPSMSQRGEKKHFRRSLLKKRCCVFWSVAHSAQPLIKLCMLTSTRPYAVLNSQATFCLLAHWARYVHTYMGVQSASAFTSSYLFVRTSWNNFGQSLQDCTTVRLLTHINAYTIGSILFVVAWHATATSLL